MTLPARIALALALGLSGVAAAQPCCVGASALTPARLTPHEDALAGVTLHAGVIGGSYLSDGRYSPAAAGSRELDLDQTLVGAVRVLSDGQVALSVPVVETIRSVPGVNEAGAGLGDVGLSFRYDLLLAGERRILPGVGLLAGFTFPTGRPPEAATTPLGTTSTGAGVWLGSLGVSFEQTWGSALASLAAVVSQSLPRTSQGITELLGPQLALSAAGGWGFENGAVSLSVSWLDTTDASVNGLRAPMTARMQWTMGLAGAWSFAEAWRIQGGVASALPWSGTARNEPLLVRFTVTLLKTWS